jgi:N-acetylglucosamine kinase
MHFVGIDGGATRTRAALATIDGAVIGFEVAGPSNYDNVGIEAARDNIGNAVRGAFRKAGISLAPLDGIFLGMAGVASPADRATITRMITDLQLAAGGKIYVDHDIRTALAGGLAGREGLALIAGTGSSVYGRRKDGRHHRVGWGYLLDDLGSSYILGLQAMIAAVWEADGRGPATLLSKKVQQALGYSHIDEIMRLVYHEDVGVTEIAALAPLVLETAEAGDEIANNIVARAAEDLAYSAYTVARMLNFLGTSFEMVMVGGLAESGMLYRKLLKEAIHRRMPECQLRSPELPPVLGAVLLALESSGHVVTPAVIAKLKGFDLRVVTS